LITKVAAASSADVDKAVAAARKAFKTTWGLNCPGLVRGQLLNKLADLLEKNADELAAIESLDNGELQQPSFFSRFPS
jgi:aldehyde dehydrogenase (NAD+)